MLPDFISAKRALAAQLSGALDPKRDPNSMLSLVTHRRAREGDRFAFTREGGEIVPGAYKPHEFTIEISLEDIQKKGFAATMEAVEKLKAGIQSTMTKEMLEKIGRAATEVGNVVEAGGKPFTAELFLEALETMELSFSQEGEWKPPTIVVHPSAKPRLAQQLPRLDAEPELQQRLGAIVERQREQWHDREANRKLVD